MRRLSRNLTAFFCGIAFVGVLAVSMGQTTGGFPSRPRFQAVGIGDSPAAAQRGTITGSATVDGALTNTLTNASNGIANQARLVVASGGDAQGQFQAGGSGRTTPLLTNGPTGASAALKTFGAIPLVFGTGNTLALTISGAQVADFVNAPTIAGTLLIESGTFTASFVTACTTTPTITYDWARAGNVVTLQAVASSGFPCTSDSTSFLSTADAPASIRPASGTGARSPPLDQFLDNGAAVWAAVQVGTGGVITLQRCATFGANCGAWTGSGNKGFTVVQQSFSYMLGNP